MRYALPGSLLVHTMALGAGLLALNWPAPNDAPSAQAVTVDVISVASVSSNQTSTIQSDATENLVSSGAKTVAAAPPETVEPIKPDTVQPIETPVQPTEPTPVKPVEMKPVEPVAAEPVESKPPTPVEPAPMEMAMLSATPVQPLETEAVAPVTPTQTSPKPVEAVQPVQAAPIQPTTAPTPAQRTQAPTLQPDTATDQKVAPVPHVLTRPRPSEPTKVATQTPRPQQPKPPTQQQPKPQPQTQPRPAAPAGNGGHNQADSAASKPSGGQQANSGSGGDAAVARYPSQVVGQLRRALRYPSGAHGASGDVQVQFVVASNGQASGIRLVQSSGNAAIDQAALDTVRRAAPFPPIPASANRSEWTFTVPLGFVRS